MKIISPWGIVKLSSSCNSNFRTAMKNLNENFGHARYGGRVITGCSDITDDLCESLKMNPDYIMVMAVSERNDSEGEPIWETILNCPQCGCDSNGSNDISGTFKYLRG